MAAAPTEAMNTNEDNTSSTGAGNVTPPPPETVDDNELDTVLPGFRFHPTEEELVEFYLRRKVEGKKFNVDHITFLDLYRYDPWELPAMAVIGEKEWYFYVYRNGDRPNRVTTSGYWKATGADRMIRSKNSARPMGLKKTFVFYSGKTPKGIRTSWIMNEYRLPDTEKYQKAEISLCRVYKRAGIEDHQSVSRSVSTRTNQMSRGCHVDKTSESTDASSSTEVGTVLALSHHHHNINTSSNFTIVCRSKIKDESKDNHDGNERLLLRLLLLPDDYEFEEETLIQLWMAGEDAMDEHIGHRCFCSLLNGGYMIHSGTDYLTKKDKFKLNNNKMKTLLDGQDHNHNSYLKWESEWKNSDTTISNEIQHVSLLCDHIDETVFQTLEQLHELRTLLFLHNYGNKLLQIPDSMFRSLKKLRALDLSGTHIRKLSSFVGCLIHLRYLDLSRTLLEWLPDTICSLYELQTLKLRGCHKLRGLPRQLKRLTKLRHLDVDVVGQVATIIPRGIGSLVNLQTSSGFLVGDEDGCKIQELKELNSITGDFCIAMLENIGNSDEAKEAALMDKQLLNKLQLRWTASQSSATDNNCYDVLENLQPCETLKELQIFCYEGPTFPNWVGNPRFTRLVSLTFFRCLNVTELPLVEQLPCLKHLELVKMNGIKEIGRRGGSEYVAFFRLEKLEINEMQSLETWSWEDANEGDYKSLVELTINDCPELRELHVLSSLCSIKHLELRECSKLESLSDAELPDSLENLIVEDCPRIKKKCLQQGGEDWYKVQHVSNIRVCTDDDHEDDDE